MRQYTTTDNQDILKIKAIMGMDLVFSFISILALWLSEKGGFGPKFNIDNCTIHKGEDGSFITTITISSEQLPDWAIIK